MHGVSWAACVPPPPPLPPAPPPPLSPRSAIHHDPARGSQERKGVGRGVTSDVLATNGKQLAVCNVAFDSQTLWLPPPAGPEMRVVHPPPPPHTRAKTGLSIKRNLAVGGGFRQAGGVGGAAIAVIPSSTYSDAQGNTEVRARTVAATPSSCSPAITAHPHPHPTAAGVKGKRHQQLWNATRLGHYRVRCCPDMERAGARSCVLILAGPRRMRPRAAIGPTPATPPIASSEKSCCVHSELSPYGFSN